MSTTTFEQLKAFHAQERKLFSKLVLNFSRPLAETILVMATWLWLEDFGFENIFTTITSLSDPLIAIFANEAVSCFRCLDSAEPPNGFNKISLTTRFMKKDISLNIIYKNRYTAITGIKNFLTTICSRAFSDIIQQILPLSSSLLFASGYRQPFIIPGFPHRTFGGISVVPDAPKDNLFLFPNGLWKWNAHCTASENDRTMFLTFSRGFPVTQVEVEELFTQKYGENCVVGVYMPEDNVNYLNANAKNADQKQQSLFARLVLDSVVTVDRILEGGKLQKFRINGKHIWARKYNEKRDGRTFLIN